MPHQPHQYHRRGHKADDAAGLMAGSGSIGHAASAARQRAWREAASLEIALCEAWAAPEGSMANLL